LKTSCRKKALFIRVHSKGSTDKSAKSMNNGLGK
jgi:hypothetical protein